MNYFKYIHVLYPISKYKLMTTFKKLKHFHHRFYNKHDKHNYFMIDQKGVSIVLDIRDFRGVTFMSCNWTVTLNCFWPELLSKWQFQLTLSKGFHRNWHRCKFVSGLSCLCWILTKCYKIELTNEHFTR